MDQRIGFIREKVDIKILILFILSNLPEAISVDELAQQTIIDDGISYFDFADCIHELTQSEHIYCELGKYGITQKGIEQAQRK